MTADRSHNWTMREPQPDLWGALTPAVLRITWRCLQPCAASNPQRLPAMESLEPWLPAVVPPFANGFARPPRQHDHELVLRAPAEAIDAALRTMGEYLQKNFPRAQVVGLEIAAHAPIADAGATAEGSLARLDL